LGREALRLMLRLAAQAPHRRRPLSSNVRRQTEVRDMPIDPEVLFLLARDYAKSMTSIRGRRVQRLLRREFSGAEHVVMIEASSGTPAVLGVSAIGAAFCSTSGKGKQVSVIKWLHGRRKPSRHTSTS
jgi:hypothetical protein